MPYIMKLKLLCIAGLLFMAACSKGDETHVSKSLSVAPTTITFAADETAARQITVNAVNTDWTFSVSESWITATVDGNYITVTVSENSDKSVREAAITVSATEPDVNAVTVTVKQQGVESTVDENTPLLSASPSELAFAATNAPAQTITVTVGGGVEWDITDSSSWITVTKSGDNTISVAVPDNATSAERQGAVTISNINKQVSVKPVYVVVTQDATDVEPSLVLVDMPEEGIVYEHYDDGGVESNIQRSSLQVIIEPVNATYTVEMVSGDDWFDARANYDRSTVEIRVVNTPNSAVDAEFVVRHENPNVQPITVKVHKKAMQVRDRNSVLEEDKNVQATSANGLIRTYHPSWHYDSSLITLGFMNGSVKYYPLGTFDNGRIFYYSGVGDLVVVRFYDVDMATGISEGTYEFKNLDPDVKTPGVIIPGSTNYYGGRLVMNDSYYVRIDNDLSKDEEYAPIISGSMTVKKNGSNYSIAWSFSSDNGHEISGSYSGPISFESRYNDDPNIGGDGSDDDFGV